jgi:hypothetical protein
MSNMAFVRRLGLSTRPLIPQATGTASISLVSLRHISTSQRTSEAQPAHNHSHDSANHVRSPQLGTGIYSAPGKYVNPYAGGPSALEKAAHLFFFTEIVRGSFNVAVYVVSDVPTHHDSRHVASPGTVLPSPIHNHVSFREGSSLPSLPWGACASSLSQRRRALYRFVCSLLSYLPWLNLIIYSMQTMRGDLSCPGHYD